ncbi:MAG TPA: glycosyltransferase, partial [Candidatus Woesebacteria bacterium]|nr:glycosyltransferase [Candidatus Woesebacteria bacterium]
MNTIDIVIVHYGDIAVTKKAIESLEKHGMYRSIIIVNNDSQICIEQNLGTHHKRKYINVGKNVGFAAGVNIGIAYAIKNDAEYVVLFNNDATAKSDFITDLLKIFQDNKKIGVISPVVRFKSGGKTVYDIGGKVQKYTGKTYHTVNEALEILDP